MMQYVINFDQDWNNILSPIYGSIAVEFVIFGLSDNNNVYNGSSIFSDFVNSGGGNDYISLGGGVSGNFQYQLGNYFGQYTNIAYGGYGSDTIVGGAGDDFIVGDAGLDVLFGGGGADHFYFNAFSDNFQYGILTGSGNGGRDYIVDFYTNSDKIILSSDYIKTYNDLIQNAAIYQDETSTVIEFNNGDGIIILNFFDVQNINSSMFLFT